MKMYWCLLLALVFLGCDLQQDISFDDPKAAPPGGPFVKVLWDKNEEDVFLDTLDKIVVQDRPVCLLLDILLGAGLEEEQILSMRFDFESEDGWRPSSVECGPLDGEVLVENGFLDPDPESMALVWSLGLRGCYWVTQLAKIHGEAVEKRPSAVLSLFRFDLFGLRLPLPLQSRPAQISFATGDSTRDPTFPDTTIPQ
jgi:hypothetical protein